MSTDNQGENQNAPKPKVYPQSPDKNSPGAKPPDLKAPRVRRAEELEQRAKELEAEAKKSRRQEKGS